MPPINKVINIATDYTEFPGGRFRRHGPGSGEEFREKFLVPLLRQRVPIIINMDGTSGYPSSFLEEAFGGLVRAGFTPEDLNGLLQFRASGGYETYARIARSFIADAGRRVH